MNKIVVVSYDVNGVNNPIKRKKIISQLKRLNCSIVLLQETHLDEKEHQKIKRDWVGQVVSSTCGEGKKKRGVAILCHRALGLTIEKTFTDKKGRYVMMVGNIGNVKVSILNLYAPNEDDPSFFKEITVILTSHAEGFLLVGGDFNCVLNQHLDKKPFEPGPTPRKTKLLHNTMQELGLMDIWRHKHPKEKEYTFFSKVHNSYSRIDFFCVSKRDAYKVTNYTLERHKAALACKRVRGRHTFDVIAAELEQIHSSFGLLNKVVATVTDNASNFVKAFKTFPPPESDEDEKEEEEEQKDVLFTDLAEALTSVSDEGHITLPPHYRCASHTINLISTSDVEKYLTSSPTTKSVYRVTIAKCTALWTKASRSTVAAEQVQEVSQRKLLVPSSTRWNSFYDAVSRVAEIPMNELNNLCNKLGIKCFNEKESLDILQGDECPYGALLPTLEILMMKSLSLKDLLTKMTADLPDVIVKVCMIQNHKKEVFPLLVNRINKLRIDLVTPVTGMEFFEFESEPEDCYSADQEVMNYLSSGGFELDTLSNFSAVKKVFLKYNTPTPSSAPVEHLFSLGGLVLTPRRNRLSDSRFEKLLLMRYNHLSSVENLK
uniref:Endonuclease/exonuclease/phosphatase domain-containing protein n=1 Tax=Oryzias latipes TaxID=8090 RepID=A0A3P9JNS2_ORYLA